MRGGRAIAVLAAGGALAVAAPSAAQAGDDDGSSSEADVRVELSCSRQSEIRLRLRTRDDDRLRVEVEVRTPRRGTSWTLVMIHERRLVLRVRRETGDSSGSFSLRRTIADWPGRDTVTVRATGPAGETCRASAAVAGD
jgi:hypothetical protein